MRKQFLLVLDHFIRIALFLIAAGLVISFIVAIDNFLITQRLYFLRTGNWDDLITISAFGILIAYVLKRLLIMQYRWGVKQ
ncbi:MAG: hypothetical protein V1776_05350 [Candidatus Diapherotrites archaeon]